MRLRFLDTYNFTPVEDRRITTKYRKNMEITCRRVDGMIAVSTGKAVEIEVPARGEGPEIKPVRARLARGGGLRRKLQANRDAAAADTQGAPVEDSTAEPAARPAEIKGNT